MPALKMKTNSATFSSKGKDLHVSAQSIVISKSSPSLAKTVQHVEEVAGSLQSHNVTQRLQDSAELTCTSNSEAIFSPFLESADVCRESNVPDDGGRNNLYIPPLETEDSESSRSSSEYEMCNVSDFYISDMIVSCLPMDGGSFDDDESLTARFLSDYKCKEPDIFANTDQTVIQSDDSSLYMAIHQLRSSEESLAFTCSESDQADSFDPLIFIRNLPEISERSIMLPKEPQSKKSVTLVLDLDETLVHSTLDHRDDADFTFPVFLNMKEHVVYVKQRPHLKTFLHRVSEMFEIVIFTASQSIYASKLLDILDPDGKLISKRAYRESCILSDGSYTKDLTVLGVDLAKVVIIDNTPQVFRLQVNNGIPIKSWFDDPSDSALISLLPFLEGLADVDDVRPVIAKKFGNKEHVSLVPS